MNAIDNSVSHWINNTVMQIPGWTTTNELLTLYNYAVATAHLGGNIVEIGSWCGRSTIVLAGAEKLVNCGHVYAIDLFPAKDDWTQNKDGSYSFRVTINDREINAYHIQTVWKEPFERDIAPIYAMFNSVYDLFLDNVKKSGLESIVRPFSGTTSMYAEQLPDNFKCRLAFIDGDHSYEAVCRDIEVIQDFLLPGGWLCFDDAFTTYEGVNRAINDKIIANTSFDHAHQPTRKLFMARKI